MAKSKRMRSGKRDINTIANRMLPFRFRIVLRPLDLSVFEDRRRFEPERIVRPVRTRSRRDQARIVMTPRGVKFKFPMVERLAFQTPLKVIICARRKVRKEVLHAKGLLSGGSGGHRRNEWSDVKC